MDINFKYGYYCNNKLFEVSADLNVSPDYYFSLKDVLKIHRVEGYPLIRVGIGNKDGGYVMVKDFSSSGTAYSFGICNDVTWDSIMAEIGYDVYMYDHTINGLPYNKKGFHFFKSGISGKDEPDSPLKTLESYIADNNHVNNTNMILKMDVEGAEWDFLETVKPEILNKFDQIMFEFHNLVKAGYGERTIKLLQKLNNSHQLVHLHGNNSGYLIKVGNTLFADVLEATYVNKNKYKTYFDEEISLPTELDGPNDPGREDVNLGKWNKPLIID